MKINGIEITEVTVTPINNKDESSHLCGFAKITLNDSFMIHGIRIYTGAKGLYMTFPQDNTKKGGGGRAYSICHPTNTELGDHIKSLVLAKYLSLAPEKEG